jgi:hypothetical protein
MSGSNQGNANMSAGASAVGINPLMPFTAAQMQANGQARSFIKQQGTKLRQPVQSGSFVPVKGAPTTINLNPQPIGLVTGYVLEIVTTVTNPAGGVALTRQPFGPFATASLLTYQNPSQFTPIQTTGWHLASVMAGREKKIPGSAYATDSPTGFGSNVQPIAAPSTIATGASGTVSVEYEIPLAYAEKLGNFQGAVFAGTTLSNQQVSFTFNPNFFDSSGTGFNAVYSVGGVGANAPTLSCTYTLYQEYYDQFDTRLINLLTPDLSTSYYLNTQPFPNLAPNQDNQVPFQNLRTFMSLTLAYNNGGAFNAFTDVNYWSLVSANQLPFWKRTASQQSWLTRRNIDADFPAGYAYFDFRDNPIATQAQGNTLLNFNPSSVGANSVLTAGWEYLGVQAVIAGAPAI